MNTASKHKSPPKITISLLAITICFFCVCVLSGVVLKAKPIAYAIYQEGNRLYGQEDFSAAIPRFKISLMIYALTGDLQGKGWSYYSIGDCYSNLQNYMQADAYYKKALSIAQEVGEKELEAEVWTGISTDEYHLGDYENAIKHQLAAIKIFREINTSGDLVNSLHNLGQILLSSGNYAEAIRYMSEALEIYKKDNNFLDAIWELEQIGKAYELNGDVNQAAIYYEDELSLARDTGYLGIAPRALSNLGHLYLRIGQYNKALKYQFEAIKLAYDKDYGHPQMVAAGYLDIGVIYFELGDYKAADKYLKDSLDASRKIENIGLEAMTLTNLGRSAIQMGYHENALQYYFKAIDLYQKTGDSYLVASTYMDIGLVYSQIGDSKKAAEYYEQASQIADTLRSAPFTTKNADVDTLDPALFILVGMNYGDDGKIEEAFQELRKALDFYKKIGAVGSYANVLNRMGFLALEHDDYQSAISYYEEASTIHNEIGDRSYQVFDLILIAKVKQDQGNFVKAENLYQEALKLASDLSDMNAQAVIYSGLGDVHKREHKIDEAIEYYKRAIGLNQTLYYRMQTYELQRPFMADVASDYENIAALFWETKRYEEAFSYIEQGRATVFLSQLENGHVDLSSKISPNTLEREQGLKDKIAARREQIFKINNLPSGQQDPVAYAEVKNELDELVTEYEELVLQIKLQTPEFASAIMVDVPPLQEIQNLLDEKTTLVEYYVTDEKLYIFVINHQSFKPIAVGVTRETLDNTITNLRLFSNLEDPNIPELNKLYGWLVTPIKGYLDTPNIGLIPHEHLHYLPFAALTDGQNYLSDQFALFILPNASSLQWLQEQNRPSIGTALIVGAPQTNLPALSYAQQEAQSIATLFDTQPLLGEDATESAIRNQATSAQIIHLAAHSEFNAVNPMFSTIFLAGDSSQDGRLEVHEIYELDLKQKTDLVVLSACQTNIGDINAGDEVISINQAFLYAGAPSIIASLWEVDDKSTMLLMQEFYQRWRNGESKADALRNAQLTIRQKYPHPYFWAGFVLTGNP